MAGDDTASLCDFVNTTRWIGVVIADFRSITSGNRSFDSPAVGSPGYGLLRVEFLGLLLPPCRGAHSTCHFLDYGALISMLVLTLLINVRVVYTPFSLFVPTPMSLGNVRTSLKVLFIGDPKVGISSFLTVLRGKPFPKLYIPTHADILDLWAMVPHRSPAEDSTSWEGWPDQPELATDSDSPTTKSTIQLLDITTYGEIYRWSKAAAYRGANAVVLCFSVARRESFESLKSKVSRLFLWCSVHSRYIGCSSSGYHTLCDHSQAFLSFSQE